MRPTLYTASSQVTTTKIIARFVLTNIAGTEAQIDIYNEATSAKTAAKKVLSITVPAHTTFELQSPVLLQEGCYVNISDSSDAVFTVIAC